MISDNFLADFKKTGLKITTPRREILKTLSTNPLSAQEVHEVLKQKNFNTDLVTVYRTLELFQTLGLVSKIQFEDQTARFELIHGNEHHHHLVCIKCGLVEDITIDESRFVKQIEKQSNFQIQRHALEFFGFCKKCQ